MNAHQLDANGLIVNTIVVDALDFIPGLIEAPLGTGIGWSYINGQFVDNRPVPETVTPPAPTKEELLAQLNALAAQIQALG